MTPERLQEIKDQYDEDCEDEGIDYDDLVEYLEICGELLKYIDELHKQYHQLQVECRRLPRIA